MKKTLVTLAAGLAMILTAASAQAVPLDTTSSTYIGSVNPGVPADLSQEADFINYLLGMPLGLTDPGVNLGNPQDPYTFSRSDNACVGCPDATAVGASNVGVGGDSPVNGIDVSNYTYLLAKYGQTSFVWYVADLASVDLSGSFGRGLGLSHYSLFNPGGTSVPDGGATLGLLGLAMLGVGYLRRRMS